MWLTQQRHLWVARSWWSVGWSLCLPVLTYASSPGCFSGLVRALEHSVGWREWDALSACLGWAGGGQDGEGGTHSSAGGGGEGGGADARLVMELLVATAAVWMVFTALIPQARMVVMAVVSPGGAVLWTDGSDSECCDSGRLGGARGELHEILGVPWILASLNLSALERRHPAAASAGSALAATG